MKLRVTVLIDLKDSNSIKSQYCDYKTTINIKNEYPNLQSDNTILGIVKLELRLLDIHYSTIQLKEIEQLKQEQKK
jgi:hypothetical protein